MDKLDRYGWDGSPHRGIADDYNEDVLVAEGL
jgi:hypothetical protein